MNHAKLIAIRIEEARYERGMSVAELGRRASIDRKRLWYILDGQCQMRADEFVRLCVVLDMGEFQEIEDYDAIKGIIEDRLAAHGIGPTWFPDPETGKEYLLFRIADAQEVWQSFDEFSRETDDACAKAAEKIREQHEKEPSRDRDDRNGMLDTSSEWRSRQDVVNANDRLLDEDYIDTSDVVEGSGIWFGQGEDGSAAEPDDKLGALPFGEYRIQELCCEANKGYALWEDAFNVSRDTTATGLDIDLGTVDDQPIPLLATEATDAADGDHEAIADDNVAIIDEVRYESLEPGREYVLTGTLIDKTTAKPVEVDGLPLTSMMAFTPTEPNGSVEVSFSFNGSELVGFHRTARVVGARVTSRRHRLGGVDGTIWSAPASSELALLVAVDSRDIVEQVAHRLDGAVHALLQGAKKRAVLVRFEGLGIGRISHGDDYGFEGGLHSLFLSGICWKRRDRPTRGWGRAEIRH